MGLILNSLLIFAALTAATAVPGCTYDRCQDDVTVGKTQTHDGDISSSSRSRRSVTSQWQPLRVHLSIQDVALSPQLRQKLLDVLGDALKKVKRLFKVKPVTGTLLLNRTASTACWQRLAKSQRCLKVHPDYKEQCLDGFEIPADHLGELHEWTANGSQKAVFRRGSGVQGADYILYVRAIQTSRCEKQNKSIIAYAAYCQIDQNNRPIAGYINFCPWTLTSLKYRRSQIYKAAMHEIFHALGFHVKLFSKFRNCANSACENTAVVAGGTRLVTPRAVGVTSSHYNCTTDPRHNQFGPLLQTEYVINAGLEVRSHWDPSFLRGSVMVPSIGQDSVAIIDPMTLSVFQDSGWYDVNFDEAEIYTWGKDAGCKFGLEAYCKKQQPYFCNKDEEGCDFSRRAKARCKTNTLLKGCHVMMPVPQGFCQYKKGVKGPGESFGRHSSCFLSSLAPKHAATRIQPRCYQRMCSQYGQVYIKVGNSGFVHCPANANITVKGFTGNVTCPPANVCRKPKFRHGSTVSIRQSTIRPSVPASAEPEPEAETGLKVKVVAEPRPEIVAQSGTVKICIEISFTEVDYKDIERSGQIINFKNAIQARVVQLCRIRKSRVRNVLLRRDAHPVFVFDLFRPDPGYTGPSLNEVYTVLADIVKERNFTFQLPNDDVVYCATGIRQADPPPSTHFTPFPVGVAVGSIVAVIVGVVLLAMLGFVLKNYFAANPELLRSVVGRRRTSAAAPTASQQRRHQNGGRDDVAARQELALAPAMLDLERFSTVPINRHQHPRRTSSASVHSYVINDLSARPGGHVTRIEIRQSYSSIYSGSTYSVYDGEGSEMSIPVEMDDES